MGFDEQRGVSWIRTHRVDRGPGNDALMTKIGDVLVRPFLSQSAADGALPCCLPRPPRKRNAENGLLALIYLHYYGPTGLFELIGAPGPAVIGAQAKDLAVAGAASSTDCGDTLVRPA